MEKILKISGQGLPLTIDDVDTDRIIPSRFLRCVTFDGIGEYAFYDERFDEKGEKTEFPLNLTIFEGADILLSGKNFGCGSSREHAPQALKRAGFKAIIAESFAEIFFGNSLTIGLPCLTMKKADIATMCRHITESPKQRMEINLQAMTVSCHGIIYTFTMPDEARYALLEGKYDLLAELVRNKPLAQAVNTKLPY